MTLIIVGREMFITNLRVFLERRGIDFSARWSGKIKMAVQCIAVPASLLSLSPEFRLWWDGMLTAGSLVLTRDVVLWAAVLITAYSGVEYSIRGFRMLHRSSQQQMPTNEAPST
jgi:CDP-diacylglycerol--glycerol-3-phosphate 3-phosphatidyltransferase